MAHIPLMMSILYVAVLPWPILLLGNKLSLTATALLKLTARSWSINPQTWPVLLAHIVHAHKFVDCTKCPE